MKKRKFRKLSLFLVIVMIFGLFPTKSIAIFAEGEIAGGSDIPINNPLTLPVKVYNSDNDTKENVLKDLKANNDSPYDVKKYYNPVAYNSRTVHLMGKPLGSSVGSSSDGYYFVSYYFTPPSEMAAAWQKGDYSVAVMYDSYKYERKYRKNIFYKWNYTQYWTNATYNNTKRSINSSGQYDGNNGWTTHGINKSTGELTWLQGGPGTYAGYGYNGYHTIGFMGSLTSTSFANIGVQMKDTIGPAVVGAYVLKDTGNPQKPYSYDASSDTSDFPKGSVVYIAVMFDEPIKLKEGTDLSSLKLKLNTTSNIDNTSLETEADFVALDCNDGMGGRALVFKYTVPENVDLRLTDINGENSNFIVNKTVLDLPGNEVGKDSHTVKSNKVRNLLWGEKIAYLDSIPPSVVRTNLKVITDRPIVTNGSSNTGLYYTAGDKLQFEVWFNEALDETKFNLQDIKLNVNIGNDGAEIEKIRTLSNPKLIIGEKLSNNARASSVLVFEYIIQAGDDTHEPAVKPLNLVLENNSKILDLRKNEFVPPVELNKPAQSIYIDTIKPVVTVTNHQYSDKSELYGYFEVSFSDDFSTTDGLSALCSLWYYNEEGDKTAGKPIDYFIRTDSETIPTNPSAAAYTGDTLTVPEIKDMTFYLHYKLPDNVECQKISLDVKAMDLAGNKNDDIAAFDLVIDKTNPVIQIEDETAYSTTEPYPEEFKGKVSIADRSSNITNYTQWTDAGTDYDDSNWIQVISYISDSKEFNASLDIVADEVNNKTLWVKSVDDKVNTSIEKRQFVYDSRGVHYSLEFKDDPSKILADHDVQVSVAPDTEFYYQWVTSGNNPDPSEYTTVVDAVYGVEKQIDTGLDFNGIYDLCYYAKSISSSNTSAVAKNQFLFSNTPLGENEITISGTQNFYVSYSGLGFEDLPAISAEIRSPKIRRTFDGIYFTLTINDKTFGGNKTVDYDSPETYYGILDGEKLIYKKPLPPLDTAKLSFPESAFANTGKYEAVVSIKSVGSPAPYIEKFPVAIEKDNVPIGGLTDVNTYYISDIPKTEEIGNPLYVNFTTGAVLRFAVVTDQKVEIEERRDYFVRFCYEDPNNISSAQWYWLSKPYTENGVIHYYTDNMYGVGDQTLKLGENIIYYQLVTPGGYLTEVRSTSVFVDTTPPDGELAFNFDEEDENKKFPAIKRSEDTSWPKSRVVDYYISDDKYVSNEPITVSLQSISDNYYDVKDLKVEVTANTSSKPILVYSEEIGDLESSKWTEATTINPNYDGSYTFEVSSYLQVMIKDPSGNYTIINFRSDWIKTDKVTDKVKIYDGPSGGYYTYENAEDTDIKIFREGLSQTPSGNFAVTAVLGDFNHGHGIGEYSEDKFKDSVSEVYFAFDKEYQTKLNINGTLDDKTGLIWHKAGENNQGLSSVYDYYTIKITEEYDGEIYEYTRPSEGKMFLLKSQFKYDASVPEGEKVPITVSIKGTDIVGNETEVKTVQLTPENVKPKITESSYSATDGYVLKFNVPVTLTGLSSDQNGKSSMVHKNVSIYYNGDHIVKFKDVYGGELEETVKADVFDTIYNHEVTVTPNTPTNTPVVIKLSTKNNQGLYIDADSIVGGTVTITDKETVAGITGKVCTAASIELNTNGTVSYTLKSSNQGVNDKACTLPINNIDTSIPTAEIEFVYFAPVENEKTTAKVVAQLTNISEVVNILNGDANYTFTQGKKGDTYTFELEDEAGNKGATTAVLPVDIVFPDVEDTNPPDYSLKFMTQNINGTNIVGDYLGEQYRKEVSEGTFELYPSQGKILIDIVPIDETEVKVSLKAPVDGVGLSGNRLTFSKNASCQVVLKDAGGLSTEVSINVEKVIDNESPKGTFDYLPNNQNVRAYITVTDNVTKSEDIAFKNSSGIAYDAVKNQYYYEFVNNGIFTFIIEDQAGNVARPQAVVGGIDNKPLTAELDRWIPSLTVDYPKEKPTDIMSKNMKVVYKLSKPIQKVEVTPAADYDKVNVSFSGDSLLVEFKENANISLKLYDYSNNTFDIVVPQVTNIDKRSPVITVSLYPAAGRAKNVKVTFTSDEDVLFTSEQVASSKDYKKTYEKSISQNGSYVASFVDKAGNLTAVDYQVSNINTEPPVVCILEAPQENAPATNKDIVVKLVSTQDGKVYYKNNTYDIVGTTITKQDDNIVIGDLTKSLPITIIANGKHDIIVEDQFQNRAAVQFEVKNIDKAPPAIKLESFQMLKVERGTSWETFKAMILKGATARDDFDNADLTSAIIVKGMVESDLITKPNTYTIGYAAADRAGNTAEVNRKVYVYDNQGILVKVNEALVEENNITIINKPLISVETNIKGPEFKTTYKKGYNTIGEMKDGKKFNGSFTVDKGGYYTIVVQTQERVYGIYYIYVDTNSK